MAFEVYIRSGQKQLRCGYTTGTCAALAALGAARMLLQGSCPEQLSLVTPKGIPVTVQPLRCTGDEAMAECAVVKDAGDDADVTHGMEVVAQVGRIPGEEIVIDGGPGVGRVTRPGLDQPVGSAAINHIPRQMIRQQVQAVREECGYEGGLSVVISLPAGEALAKRSFNPMLGVEGGLSILGTSGIVEPMSQQAIVDTIALEQRQAAAAGAKRLILTPGNYGMDFLREQGWLPQGIPVVKCSNFIGDALDIAATLGFETLLLVGHIGKLVKLAGGVMNTHSRYADCRTELICAHAAVCGAGRELCARLLSAATTDACLALLETEQLREAVMQSLLAAIQTHLERRVGGAYRVGALLFSNQYGLLGRTDSAAEILRQWEE